MSVAHFERTFKACTGMTPHDYYIKTKVNKLKEALLNQNKGVEQAFSECGLPYHGHYAQLFKRETGLTPPNTAKWRSRRPGTPISHKCQQWPTKKAQNPVYIQQNPDYAPSSFPNIIPI